MKKLFYGVLITVALGCAVAKMRCELARHAVTKDWWLKPSESHYVKAMANLLYRVEYPDDKLTIWLMRQGF